MKQFDKGIIVNQNEFEIIQPKTLNQVSKKQKYNMIYHNFHLFKKTSETNQLAFKSFNENIDSVYTCTHCNLGKRKNCNCKFITINAWRKGKCINSN